MQFCTWFSKNFSNRTSKNTKTERFNRESRFRSTLKISYRLLLNTELAFKALKDLFLVLVVLITAKIYVLYSY